MKNKKYSSRQKTPWDNNVEINKLQEFIKNKYQENYKIKHPKLADTNEAIIFNEIKIAECRHCNSKNIKKNGKDKNGVQKYFCRECHKEFIPTTNTIFENHKISLSEWVEFLLDIFNYGSSTLTSKVNKNSVSTSIYWLHKMFLVLRDWQNNIVLTGTVYIDEMFYSVIKSDVETKDGKKLRGLSRNQHCIGIGYDGTRIIAIVEGLGKTSTQKTIDTFESHISEGSKLIHDDEKAHRKLVKELGLENESYGSHYLKTKKDKDNPLRPINHQCDLLRQFLNAHSGFNRDYLQDYLNLYCFINTGCKNKLEKVYEFLELALSTKITFRYRELFNSSNNF